MSKTTFTPAPWRLINVPKTNPKLHQIIGPAIIKREISEADAHLIAAAPELFESLTEVMEWISNWSPEFEGDLEWKSFTKPKVRAALSKARGEAQ